MVLVGEMTGVWGDNMGSMSVKKYKRFRDFCYEVMKDENIGYTVEALLDKYSVRKGVYGKPSSKISAGNVMTRDNRFVSSDKMVGWQSEFGWRSGLEWFLNEDYEEEVYMNIE